jgi:hypothetical protein
MQRILLRALPARSRGCKGEATMTIVSRQVLDDLDGRSDMVIGRLTMIRQAIVSGASACCGRFLAALHESRRKQGAIERARYRHLIYDADTGMHFGADPAAGRSTSTALASVTGGMPHA